jgi:hypothetical protein
VVTGSTALYYMGLVDEASDLDIILVNPTDETKNILERLQKDNPAKTSPKENCEVNFIFNYDGIKVDIFFLQKKVDTMLQVNGFAISKISTIIEAKKRFSRMKDWVQLRTLSRMFFKNEEFEKYLDCKPYKYGVNSKDGDLPY